MEKVEAQSPQGYTLAHELLKKESDRDSTRAHLLNVFLAAHDTTAILMNSVLFNLARNPNVYNAFRREVCSHGELRLSLDELQKIKTLWHTVLETLQLTPAVGQSARIALEDTTLPKGGGKVCQATVFIPKGTAVQLDYLAMNRNPDIFGGDVHTFRPARWDEINAFSSGPRICPGQHLALMQVCYVVGRIAQQFARIKNRNPVQEFVELYRIISFSKNGCKVSFEKNDLQL